MMNRYSGIEEKKGAMAKFSVDGEDDGAGPSSTGPRSKRQRLLLRLDPQTQPHPQTLPPPPLSTIGETNDDHEEDESDDHEEGSDHEEEDDLDGESDSSFEFDTDVVPNPAQAQAQTQTLVRNSLPPRSTAPACNVIQSDRQPVGSLTMSLVDPDVLDCSICFEPLCPPVYQCENGHIACSSCCTKIGNKCPSCSLPIGYNRCRAIEKVVESIKISCLNSRYGCNETMSYSKRSGHEKICLHVPCSCPLADCDFVGSSKLLYAHFSGKHPRAAKRFRYSTLIDVSMKVNEKDAVLQECVEGTLFIISNETLLVGNVISISCIGPSTSKERYRCEVTAKFQDTYLNLVSSVKMSEGQGRRAGEAGFLLIPTGFSICTGYLNLNICIWQGSAIHPTYAPRTISSLTSL